MESSLSERAYETLKKDILTLALAPGQQIAQPGLVEQYGIGMTPIREALQRLVREGFVQPISRLGFMVSPITLSDVREIYELRTLHEVAAARWACLRGSDAQLQDLLQGAGFTPGGDDRESRWVYVCRNAAFHRAIAVASGNQRLASLIARQMDDLTRVLYVGLDLQYETQERADEHTALAQALCARDPTRAEGLVRAQIEHSLRTIQASLARGVDLGQARGPDQAVRFDSERR